MRIRLGWRTLAVVLAVAVVVQAALVANGVAPLGIAVVIALLFLLALRAPAPATWCVLAATMGVLGTVEVLAADARGEDHDLPVVLLLLALAAVAGLSLRYHRAFVAEAVARAEAAERGAEEEARRRVADVRLRLARDLHDSVAHHMAVVNMQATAAGRVLTTDPQTATAMLDQVRDAACAAIAETATLVGDLRDGTGPLAPGAAAPTTSLGTIADLLAPVEAAGGRVDIDAIELIGLGQDTEVLCYRLLTEALTNAARHAPGGDVAVMVSRPAGHVQIEIVNSAPAAPPVPTPSGGHGLIGMRERVEAVGGAFGAGPTADGGFRVYAELPVVSR